MGIASGNSVQNTSFPETFWKNICIYRKIKNANRFHRNKKKRERTLWIPQKNDQLPYMFFWIVRQRYFQIYLVSKNLMHAFSLRCNCRKNLPNIAISKIAFKKCNELREVELLSTCIYSLKSTNIGCHGYR